MSGTCRGVVANSLKCLCTWSFQYITIYIWPHFNILPLTVTDYIWTCYSHSSATVWHVTLTEVNMWLGHDHKFVTNLAASSDHWPWSLARVFAVVVLVTLSMQIQWTDSQLIADAKTIHGHYRQPHGSVQ